MTERTKHRICALLVAACFLLATHMEYQDVFGVEDAQHKTN